MQGSLEAARQTAGMEGDLGIEKANDMGINNDSTQQQQLEEVVTGCLRELARLVSITD